MMNALLLTMLAAAPGERLLSNEVGVDTGVYGSAFAADTARQGDVLYAIGAHGRLLFSGFTAEAHALAKVPFNGLGAGFSLDLVPRIGWTGERWSVLLGAVVQLAPAARPVTQVLPSVRAQVDFGSFGLSAGLFDLYGQVPFHLSAELGDYSIGYVAPLGLAASMRFRVGDRVQVKIAGFAYRLFNSEAGLITLGVTFGP